MKLFKRGLALLLAVCMVMGYIVIDKTVTASAETYDPYVYTFAPDSSSVPAYYKNYAKAFVGWSPHEIAPDAEPVWMFNLVNMSQLVTDQSKAPSGSYASVSTFCGDLFVDVNFGNRYRRVELEDTRFGSASKAGHVRALLEKSMPYLYDPAVVQAAANAYLGSNKVSNLTGSQLASAIQAAVWYYTDSDEFAFTHFNPAYFAVDNPYFGTVDYFSSAYSWMIPQIMSQTSPLDIDEGFSYPRTSDNIYGVFCYLRDLAPKAAQDVMIPQDAISLKNATVMGSGNNCTMKLTVAIKGTIDSDDALVLTAKCGSQTKTYQLGKTTTAEKVGSGLYAITFTGVSLADCASVDLALSGDQKVTGAYYFEAEPRGNLDAKNSSQGMVGYLQSSPAPVQAKATVKPLANAVTTEITKVDKRSGNPLAGVAFDLYMKQSGGDVLVGSFVTDSNGKISVTVTDASAEYYFVETKALPGYQAVSGAVTGKVTNDWNSGSLSVSKKLVNEASVGVSDTFSFRVTLDLSTATVAQNGLAFMTDEYFENYLQCDKPLQWTTAEDGKFTAVFSLKADETLNISGIAQGSTYTVQEQLTDAEKVLFKTTVKVDNGTAKTGTSASGTIAKENALLFTNTVVKDTVEYGELSISKKLVNDTPAVAGEVFKFKITLDLATDKWQTSIPWIDDAYLLSKISCDKTLSWKEENGKFVVEIDVLVDETVTLSGIANGTAYTVEEVLDADGVKLYKVESVIGETVTEGTKTAGEIDGKEGITYTNTVVTADVQVGEVEVSKKLINNTPAEPGETFNFKITLDLSTADVWEDEIPWMNNDYLMGFIESSEELTWTVEEGKYVAEFTVDVDETVTISGIAQGTTYTVEEIQTEEDRAWFTVTTQIGKEEAVEGNTATGTVAEKNALIFTNSVVTADVELGKLSISKKVVNAAPAREGETFTFRIVIDFSTAAAYENPVPWMNDAYLLSLVSSSKELNWVLADEGIYTAMFTLQADETITIEGLAVGTGYAMREELTEEGRKVYMVSTQITTDGAAEAVKPGCVAGCTVAAENAVVYTNDYVEVDSPETGDTGIGLPMLLCVITLLGAAALVLNRRRFL